MSSEDTAASAAVADSPAEVDGSVSFTPEDIAKLRAECLRVADENDRLRAKIRMSAEAAGGEGGESFAKVREERDGLRRTLKVVMSSTVDSTVAATEKAHGAEKAEDVRTTLTRALESDDYEHFVQLQQLTLSLVGGGETKRYSAADHEDGSGVTLARHGGGDDPHTSVGSGGDFLRRMAKKGFSTS
jgi:hypothetical protein